MSRVIAQGAGAPDEGPALVLLPEDESEMLDAVAELNKSINAVSRLASSFTAPDNSALTTLIARVIQGQAAVLDQLKALQNKRPHDWDFHIIRHPNGDAETIRARAIK